MCIDINEGENMELWKIEKLRKTMTKGYMRKFENHQWN